MTKNLYISHVPFSQWMMKNKKVLASLMTKEEAQKHCSYKLQDVTFFHFEIESGIELDNGVVPIHPRHPHSISFGAMRRLG